MRIALDYDANGIVVWLAEVCQDNKKVGGICDMLD